MTIARIKGNVNPGMFNLPTTPVMQQIIGYQDGGFVGGPLAIPETMLMDMYQSGQLTREQVRAMRLARQQAQQGLQANAGMDLSLPTDMRPQVASGPGSDEPMWKQQGFASPLEGIGYRARKAREVVNAPWDALKGIWGSGPAPREPERPDRAAMTSDKIAGMVGLPQVAPGTPEELGGIAGLPAPPEGQATSQPGGITPAGDPINLPPADTDPINMPPADSVLKSPQHMEAVREANRARGLGGLPRDAIPDSSGSDDNETGRTTSGGASSSRGGTTTAADALKRDALKSGSIGDALIALGLGMMSSKSPHFLSAVGEGGIAALKHMTERRKEDRDEYRLAQQDRRLDSAERRAENADRRSAANEERLGPYYDARTREQNQRVDAFDPYGIKDAEVTGKRIAELTRRVESGDKNAQFELDQLTTRRGNPEMMQYRYNRLAASERANLAQQLRIISDNAADLFVKTNISAKPEQLQAVREKAATEYRASPDYQQRVAKIGEYERLSGGYSGQPQSGQPSTSIPRRRYNSETDSFE